MSDKNVIGNKSRNIWAGLIAILAFAGGQLFLYLLEAPMWLEVAYCVGFLGLAFGSTARHHSYVFIFRVYVPVVVALGLTWLYFWFHAQPQFAAVVEVSRFKFSYIELLFTILSTLYAICTAFLLWKGLSDHDMLRHVLRDEANQIQKVLGFLHYFDLGKPCNRQLAMNLRRNLQTYVTNILHGDHIQSHEENFRILRQSIFHISAFELEDENDRIALSEIMKAMSDLVMIRSKRISQMEIGMSPYILSALLIMSGAVIYPFFTAGWERAGGGSDYVNASCVFVLGGLLSFLQMMLFDISRPFDGFWKIKTDAFEKIQTFLEEEIRAETASVGVIQNVETAI